MKIVVQAFAEAAEVLGFRKKQIDVKSDITVAELIRTLANTNNDFKRIAKTLFVAINEEYCSLDAVIHENDVVDLIPPVGGG
ncbi:MAG: MoaD/ThiS family protein [Spirochaetes bacterium]|nr:MoaD/ThiS family protein [Spirochaetota bacterium]